MRVKNEKDEQGSTPVNQAAIDALVAELTCDNVIKCQNARRALVAIGGPAIPILVEALSSKKQWVRWEAAKALGQIKDPAAIQTLIKTLEDDNFDLRWLAAEGLINIGRPAVVPLLLALLVRPGSAWLQQGAHRVLLDMRKGELRQILQPVIKALESMQPSMEVPLTVKAALDKLEVKYPKYGQ